MITPAKRECTDCDGTMHEVKMVDKGHGNQSHPLEYAAVDARPSFWIGQVPYAGAVAAFLCESCGLIKLYGVPHR